MLEEFSTDDQRLHGNVNHIAVLVVLSHNFPGLGELDFSSGFVWHCCLKRQWRLVFFRTSLAPFMIHLLD